MLTCVDVGFLFIYFETLNTLRTFLLTKLFCHNPVALFSNSINFETLNTLTRLISKR